MKSKYRFLLLLLMCCAFVFVSTKPIYAQHKALSSLEEDITNLVESIKPSLVTIETESQILKGERRENPPPTFVGSGVIYTSDGYIVTTASVVGRMKSFKVTLPDRTSVRGKLVGTDEQSNLAVLKVDVTGLTPAKLGDSEKVRVGSWLTVVGNSYGLPNAVALGLVNGVREDGFIQMSANVSPGNSGGPVLDIYGKVIGLVSAKLSEPSYINAIRFYEKAMNKTITIPSREIELPSSGVSLALPINKAKTIADEIIKYGSLKRGYLGIYPIDLDEKHDFGPGTLVSQVVKGSPAEKAGLLEGDLILEFGGTKVINSAHIRQLIESKRTNEQVKVKIMRDGRASELTAVLGEAKPSFSYFWMSDKEAPTPEVEYVNAYQSFMQAQEWTDEENRALDQLRREMDRLKLEMQKLNEEMQKLKLEKQQR